MLLYNNQDQEPPCSSQGLEHPANQSGQELNLLDQELNQFDLEPNQLDQELNL